LKPRLRFARAVVVNGYEWAKSVTDTASRLVFWAALLAIPEIAAIGAWVKNWSPGWLAVLWPLGFLLLAMGEGAYRATNTASTVIPIPSPGLSDGEVRKRCRELAQRLNDAIDDYKREQISGVLAGSSLAPKASERRRTEEWNRRNAEYSQSSARLMGIYRREQGHALRLYDEAIQRGWPQTTTRNAFELPTNPGGVEEVARTLATWGVDL
jgi:hypothetical protein